MNESICETCGCPENDSKHIRHDADLENPVKHQFVRAASPASGAAPQPPTYAHMCCDGHEPVGFNTSENERCPVCRVMDDREALTLKLFALAAPATGKRVVEWVIVAEGEGAEARLVFDADPHEEIHRFMCVCGNPWRECTTDGMREDVARFDDPDEWGFDEAGKPYSVAWRHETGTVKVFRVRAALEAAAG